VNRPPARTGYYAGVAGLKLPTGYARFASDEISERSINAGSVAAGFAEDAYGPRRKM
jgi:hypothetical protein